MARPLRLATRGSPLALRQAETVSAALAGADGGGPEVELVVVQTAGDLQRDRPIAAISGQGAFVTALEQALCDDRADLAVHSAKDLPSSFGVDGLGIVAVPERGDPRDALVGCDLDELGPGAHVATGAARRRAQLAWLRPDLRFVELRGNIETRLSKVPAEGAVVIAYAALQRLGLSDLASGILSFSTMLPQVGQGALAVQCRLDDEAVCEAVRAIDDVRAHRCLDAERAFLAELGGGCELPVGAYAEAGPEESLVLKGVVASLDGLVLLRRELSGREPVELGRKLARLLRDRSGGAQILSTDAGSR